MQEAEQMTINDWLNKQMPERSCGRRCDVAFGSLTCFERRGYLYDRQARKWLRREDGKIMITKAKACSWVPVQEMDFSCFTSWKNPQNKNGIKLASSDCQNRKCTECEVYQRFYNYVDAIQHCNEISFPEALQEAYRRLGIESFWLRPADE